MPPCSPLRGKISLIAVFLGRMTNDWGLEVPPNSPRRGKLRPIIVIFRSFGDELRLECPLCSPNGGKYPALSRFWMSLSLEGGAMVTHIEDTYGAKLVHFVVIVVIVAYVVFGKKSCNAIESVL